MKQTIDDVRQLAAANADAAQSLQWKLDLLRKAVVGLSEVMELAGADGEIGLRSYEWDRGNRAGYRDCAALLRALLKEQP